MLPVILVDNNRYIQLKTYPFQDEMVWLNSLLLIIALTCVKLAINRFLRTSRI